MSLRYFTVAYYDESGIWDQFSPHIASRLPIYGVNLNLPEGDILMPPLPLKFVSHTEAFWQEEAEFSYKKPYLWIFVLKFTNFEIFKRDIKPKIKELITQMQLKNIEWLVVFVPSFSRLVKSDHKNFLSAFSKVSSDLQSLFGKVNISKFYCGSNKTFVDLSQPSCIKDDYWLEFIKSVGKGVSIGIQTAICTHLKASCVQMDSNFKLYALNLFAMSLLYEAIGVKNQASLYLEMIREKVFWTQLLHSTQEDFSQDCRLDGESFSELLLSEKLTKVRCFRFLTDRITDFLMQEKQIERASGIVSNSLGFFWGLFKLSPSESFLKFLETYCETSVQLIQSKLSGKRYSEVMKENRQFIYLSIANMLTIKLNILIHLQQHFLESQGKNHENLSEELLEVSKKIYESFAFAGYPSKTLLYKYQASSFLLSLGLSDRLGEVINQHSDWPSIDSLNKQLLLKHDKTLSNSDKMKYISEICSNQYFSQAKLKKMWSKLAEYSKTSSAFYSFHFFKTHTLKNFEAKQGQVFHIKVLFINPLSFALDFQRMTGRYSKDFVWIEVSAEEVVLNPGHNFIDFQGIAWDSGSYKLESLTGHINRYSCTFPVLTAFLQVTPCKKVLKPTLFPFFQSSKKYLLVVELKSFNIDCQDVQILINFPSGVTKKQVQIEERAEIFCFQSKGMLKTVSEINENQLVLENMDCNCFSYISYQVWSSCLKEALVQFDLNSDKGGSKIETKLRFDESLQVKVETLRDLVSVRIVNLNETKVQLLNIQVGHSVLDVVGDQLPIMLENEQEFHTFSQVTEFPTVLTITYINLFQGLKPLFSSQVLQDKPQEVRYSLPIQTTEQ